MATIHHQHIPIRRYSEVRDQIPQAATLLWQRRFRPSNRLIAALGRSVYCHASKAVWAQPKGRPLGIDLYDVGLEQFHGGMVRPLAEMVRQYPGRIDVYRPNAGDRWDGYSRHKAAREMLRLAQSKYGYWSILRLWASHTPILRLLLPPDTDDLANGTRPLVCSAAVAYADHHAGVDVVRNLADRSVEPGDLARSLFYEPMFTLVP